MRVVFGLMPLMAFGAAPAAAEVALIGNARLGLGYNILNNGEPDYRPTARDDGVVTGRGGSDALRAISRIRFGVLMTGETDGGIGFGATIRADNAPAGDGGEAGQRAGEVFVTGAWGTLSYGDVDGADDARVGDAVANVALTGLGDYNETPFLSNGGGSNNDALQFITDPAALPTVRYDFDVANFGISLSTDRDLGDVGVGASYTVAFEAGTVTAGVGYYDFEAFTGMFDEDGRIAVAGGEQWSASLTGSFGPFQGGVAYTQINAGAAGAIDVLNVGGGGAFGRWTVLAYYSKVTQGTDLIGGGLDGSDSYGASARYDLGGGAAIAAGLVRSYGLGAIGTPGDAQYEPEADPITMADFGITVAF